MMNVLIEFANSMSHPWVRWVCASLLDASALLVLVGVLWFVIRRRVSPQVGYCLFLLVPLKLILPVSVTVPSAMAQWTPSVLVSSWFEGNREHGNVESRPAMESVDIAVVSGETSRRDHESVQLDIDTIDPLEQAQAVPQTSGEFSQPVESPAQAATPSKVIAAPHPIVTHPNVNSPRLSVSAIGMIIWILGVTFLLGRLVRTQLRFRKRLRQLETVEGSRFGLDLGELCRRVKVSRPVQVIVSDDVSAPAVWGITRPTIILPIGIASTLSSEQLQWVMLHELAHIRRGDLLVVVVQRLIAVLQFFNPAIWIANRMIHRLREYACDDLAVLLSDGSAVDSGEAFLLILKQATESRHSLNGALGVFGMDSRAACFQRVRRLLDTERSIHLGLDRLSLIGLVLLAAITLPHIHAAQDGNQPDLLAQARDVGVNSVLLSPDNPKPNAGAVVAKDNEEFELIVVSSDGKPVPEATVELRTDPNPTAEQIRQGKIIRTGDFGTFVATNSEGQVAMKWSQSPGKTLLVRITASGYQPYWSSWPSENDAKQVSVKSTVKLTAMPVAHGLPYRDGGKAFLGREGGGVFFVAAIDAVRKEIALDSATASKVQILAEQYSEEMDDERASLRGFVAELRGLSPEERKKKNKERFEKRQAEVKQANEKYFSQLKAVLTAEQFERLQQIALQAYGTQALEDDPELAKALELTEEQGKRITAVRREYQRKRDELFRTWAPLATYQEIDKERYDKVKELLTQEQQQKLTKLEGRPFTLTRLTSPTLPEQFGWFGGSIIFLTVINSDVQKDLGLDEGAVTRMKEFHHQFREAKFRAGGGFTMRQVRLSEDKTVFFTDAELPSRDHGEWNALTSKFQTRLQEALTTDQYIRLQQIHWQARGTAAYSDPEVIQALGISKEQQNQIASITAEYRNQRQKLSESGDGADSELLRKMTDLIREHDTKVHESLTKAQRDMFSLMKGKPFDLDQLRIMDPFPLGERRQTASRGGQAGSDSAGSTPAAGPFAGRGGGRPGVAAGLSPIIGNGGIFSVAKNEAAQKELGLSEDVSKKVDEVNHQFNKAWVEVHGGFRIRHVRLARGNQVTYQEAAMPPFGIQRFPGQTEDQRKQELAKMMELWKANIAKFQVQLKELLTADQFVRLQQINWQAMGTAAYYSDSDVIEKLGITKELQEKITSITEEYVVKRLESLRQGVNGGAERKEIVEKMNEVNKEQDAKINELLTKDQLDQLATMKGKAFDLSLLLDVQPMNGRGGNPARPNQQPPKAEPKKE